LLLILLLALCFSRAGAISFGIASITLDGFLHKLIGSFDGIGLCPSLIAVDSLQHSFDGIYLRPFFAS
jgi:hypothetical protein